MRSPRVGCVWVPNFPIAALRRDAPEYRGIPVALLEPGPGGEGGRWVAVSEEARASGVVEGQTVVQAQAVCPDLAVVPRESVVGIRSAMESLERALRQVAPSVEAEGDGLFFLDVRGLTRLHGGGIGDERGIVRAMREAVAVEGFEARYGIARTRFAAFAAALATGEGRAAGEGTIVPPGGEREFLAPLPLDVLPMSRALAERVSPLGIRTIGDYAALPATSVERRYGEEGVRLHRLACGIDDPFVPTPPPSDERLVAADLEPPIDGLVELLSAIEKTVAPLFAEMTRRGEGASDVLLVLALEGGGVRTLRLHAAQPTARWEVFERFLRIDLERGGLPARVAAFRLLVAEASKERAESRRLFAGRLRDPAQILIAIGEIQRLYGSSTVLCPAIEDRHRPEARRRFEVFRPRRGAPREPSPTPAESSLPPLCRWIDPPESLRVTLEADRLKGLYYRGRLRAAIACVGPQRISGEWWEQAFERDYYDVETSEGGRYRVFRDLENGGWYLQSIVD